VLRVHKTIRSANLMQLKLLKSIDFNIVSSAQVKHKKGFASNVN
jgi:hypothetical protein